MAATYKAGDLTKMLASGTPTSSPASSGMFSSKKKSKQSASNKKLDKPEDPMKTPQKTPSAVNKSLKFASDQKKSASNNESPSSPVKNESQKTQNQMDASMTGSDEKKKRRKNKKSKGLFKRLQDKKNKDGSPSKKTNTEPSDCISSVESSVEKSVVHAKDLPGKGKKRKIEETSMQTKKAVFKKFKDLKKLNTGNNNSDESTDDSDDSSSEDNDFEQPNVKQQQSFEDVQDEDDSDDSNSGDDDEEDDDDDSDDDDDDVSDDAHGVNDKLIPIKKKNIVDSDNDLEDDDNDDDDDDDDVVLKSVKVGSVVDSGNDEDDDSDDEEKGQDEEDSDDDSSDLADDMEASVDSGMKDVDSNDNEDEDVDSDDEDDSGNENNVSVRNNSGFCPPEGIVHESLLQQGKKRKVKDDSDDEDEPVTKKKKADKASTRPRRDRQAKLTDNRTVFVGNISLKSTKKELKSMFAKCGEVESVRFRCLPVNDPSKPKKVIAVKKDFHPGRTNCVGFVKYKSPESAIKALALNGSELKGLHVRVDMAARNQERNMEQGVFIGNLPYDIEEEAVLKHFNDCGEIEGVRLVRDKATSLGKGFGFVNFKDSDGATFALKLNESKLLGRKIRVVECSQQQQPTFGDSGAKKVPKKEKRKKPNSEKGTKKNLKKIKKEKKKKKMVTPSNVGNNPFKAAKDGSSKPQKKKTEKSPNSSKPTALEKDIKQLINSSKGELNNSGKGSDKKNNSSQNKFSGQGIKKFGDKGKFGGNKFADKGNSPGNKYGDKGGFGGNKFGDKGGFGGNKFGDKGSFGGKKFGDKGSYGGKSFGDKGGFGGKKFGDKGNFVGKKDFNRSPRPGGNNSFSKPGGFSGGGGFPPNKNKHMKFD